MSLSERGCSKRHIEIHSFHKGSYVSFVVVVPLGVYPLFTPVMCPVLVMLARHEVGVQIIFIFAKGVNNQ